MSCSALFETSSTYRKRLSTPSGKPSIPFLLEALGHPGDAFERRFRLQFFRDDRRLETLGGDLQIVVDDDVVVELFGRVDLVDRLLEPRLDLLITVQTAVAKPLFQNIQRGRKDEDVQLSLFELAVFRDLLRALIVDVEDDVLPVMQAGDDLSFRSPVQLLMNESPLEKFPGVGHGLKLLMGNEIVVFPLHLAGTRVPGRMRDGKVQVDPDGLELFAGLVDECRLPRAGRAGDDE